MGIGYVGKSTRASCDRLVAERNVLPSASLVALRIDAWTVQPLLLLLRASVL